MTDSTQKLRLGALIALVVGSMVGGGIFSLPQNIAASASAGATLIGWLITGVGMLTLAFVFQTLANRKPQLDGGVRAWGRKRCSGRLRPRGWRLQSLNDFGLQRLQDKRYQLSF